MIPLSRVAGRRRLTASLLRAHVACLVALGVASASAAVQAQASEQDAERAERFFVEGRSAMKARRYEEACAKFAESHHVDPASGTLLNLAVCREAQGRTATAWTHYGEGLALSRTEENVEGERFAKERLQALEATLCRLTIVPPETGRTGLLITLDGGRLDPELWGSAMPVDPGKHVVAASAPDRKPWTQSISVVEQGTQRIVRVPPLLVATPTTRAPTPLSSSNAGEDSEFRWDVAIPGAISVLGFAGTTYFGLRAKSEWDTRNEHCPSDVCDDQAVEASERASRFALVSSVSAGVGIAGAAVAVYFLVYPARGDGSARLPVNVRVTRSGADVTLGGAF
ncbi:MAG TPA: hypothetical protein VFZ53_10945 [Polyangiaceae bacterium]